MTNFVLTNDELKRVINKCYVEHDDEEHSFGPTYTCGECGMDEPKHKDGCLVKRMEDHIKAAA